jgi:hypothetical protein
MGGGSALWVVLGAVAAFAGTFLVDFFDPESSATFLAGSMGAFFTALDLGADFKGFVFSVSAFAVRERLAGCEASFSPAGEADRFAVLLRLRAGGLDVVVPLTAGFAEAVREDRGGMLIQ